MIVRLWQVKVSLANLEEYARNELIRSLPMFRQQQGCLGVLFLRSKKTSALTSCSALTFWTDQEAVDRLKTSPSYQAASEFYEESGLIADGPSLDAFELQNGFLDASSLMNLLGTSESFGVD